MTQRYSTARKSGPIPRPNIVYVCSDQHAFKYAGHAGHSLVRSPNLDRIAQEGVVFSNAYCGSPVCVPSRSCLLATNKQGVATLEVGVTNDSNETLNLSPSIFRISNHNGKTLPLLTREEAIKSVRHEQSALEADLERARDIAQAKVATTPTLDELVGSSRAQSYEDKILEEETFGEPLAAPERRQKQYNINADIRSSANMVRRVMNEKIQALKEYYFEEVVLPPDEAYNGILMVKIKKQRSKWIILEVEIQGQKYFFKFELS